MLPKPDKLGMIHVLPNRKSHQYFLRQQRFSPSRLLALWHLDTGMERPQAHGGDTSVYLV